MESAFHTVNDQYFACSAEQPSRLLASAPRHDTPKARLFTYLKNKSLNRSDFNSSRLTVCDDATCLDAGNKIAYSSPCAYRQSPVLGEQNISVRNGIITESSFHKRQFLEPPVSHESGHLSSKICYFASGQNTRRQSLSPIASSPGLNLGLRSLANYNPCRTSTPTPLITSNPQLLFDFCKQTEKPVNHVKDKQKQETRKHENQLENWNITMSNDGLIRLSGFVNGRKYYRRTKAVKIRHSKNIVQTSSGSRYKLIGLRQINRDEANAPYEPFLVQFNNGFPWNWREILQVVKTEMKSSDEKCDESTASKSDVEVSALNNETLSLSKSKRSTFMNKEPIQEEELRKSKRSGRIIYPPLAHWANQRVICRNFCDGVSNVHVQGNENALCLPVRVNFQSSQQEKKTRMNKSASHRSSRAENSKIHKQSIHHSKPFEDKSASVNHHNSPLNLSRISRNP